MRALGGRAESWTTALPGLLALGAVGLTAAVDGGYFPTEWGWATLAFLLVALLAVLVRDRVAVGRLELLAAGLLAAFTAWTLLSGLWSSSWTLPILAAERTLVYLSALVAVFLMTSRGTAAWVAGGVLAAATAVSSYALLTRLVPGRIESFPPPDGYQLATPIGYWNALGLLAVVGALIAIGFVAGDLPPWARALAAAPTPVLLATLYFTFSRGSWLSLVAGLCLALAFARRRLRLLAAVAALVLPAAVAVAVATRSDTLTHEGATLHAARVEGAELAAVVAGCIAAAAAIGWALAALEPRARVGRTTRTRIGWAIAAAVVLGVVAVVVRAGGPAAMVRDATHSFRSDLPETGGDLNRRLVSLSADGRREYWRVAWREIETHPALGGGAGSFERWWHRERRVGYEARNTHNLYLETLAEVGPVGLLLLAGALAVPLVAARRLRDAAVPAVGAYGAFLVHSAVDWDWQIPAVVLAALLSGAAILVAARPDEAGRALTNRFRAAVAVVLLPLIAFAVVEQVGNRALAGSVSANDRGDPGAAAHLARRAHTWAPWSFEPWQRLGEAQLAEGNLPAARASFRRAIRIEPEEWSLWAGLAEATTGAERRQAQAEARRLNPRA